MKLLKLLFVGCLSTAVLSCGGGSNGNSPAVSDEELVESGSIPGAESEIAMKELTVGQKTYTVADITDESHVYKRDVNRDQCLVVISKREFRLYVYECGDDTVLAASFPVCYAKNPGPKTREGDMSTPECTDLKDPFTISEIKSASDWEHDFGDGRGSLKAYGDWFVRLKLTGALSSNRSIGIHGSTNNAESVPGRDSEGCVRLRDADINLFHDLYAQVGQKVLIKGVGEKKLPFEQHAELALGERYVAPVAGNKLLAGGEPDDASRTVDVIDDDDIGEGEGGFMEGDSESREGEVG